MRPFALIAAASAALFGGVSASPATSLTGGGFRVSVVVTAPSNAPLTASSNGAGAAALYMTFTVCGPVICTKTIYY